MRARARQVLAAVVLGWAAFAPPAARAEAPALPALEEPVDPGLDGWGPYGLPSPEPGLFFNTELAFIHPVLRNRLTNDTPLRPSGNTLTVPSAELPWTVAPWFDLGYRLPRSLGIVSLNYRFFTADGNGTTVFAGLPSELRSRLGENVVNLDYGTGPCSFAPRWDFLWRIGAQYADVFFDSRLAGGSASQQASNHFNGAGPHARLDLSRSLDPLPGWSLFSRLDGAVVFGRISQKFSQQTAVLETWEQNGTQSVPVLNVQAGLSYTPPALPGWRFTLGYTYEHWWYVGQLGEDSNDGSLSRTRGEFETQGIFLRGQVDF